MPSPVRALPDCSVRLTGSRASRFLWLLRLLLPRRMLGHVAEHADCLLLPGQGLLDRHLSGWSCGPLLLCGAGLRLS